MNFILISGTFKDGFTFYGPFETEMSAWKFAESECIADSRAAYLVEPSTKEQTDGDLAPMGSTHDCE